MKIFYLTLCSLLFLVNVNAETFTSALKKAYENNSELNAERESLNISEQEHNISKGSYLPKVTLSGSKSEENTDKLTNRDGSNADITDVDPTIKSITVTQTLIDFGRGAELAKSKIGIELAKAKLVKKEQEILYKSIQAYTGLVSAKEKLKINRSNVDLLDRQVETDKIRLERGGISLSDVAQSESSLAGAQAKFIQAENDFLTSKLNYENVIGKINDPELLDKSSILKVSLPNGLNSAIELSKKNNPDLIIAQLEYEQSKKDTKSARSDLAPSATLSYNTPWPPQNDLVEERIQEKMMQIKMGNAKTELRFLERELERLQDMGLDDISKYAGKRFFDPRAVLKGSNNKMKKMKRRKKRRGGGGEDGDVLPGIKSPLRSPSGAARMLGAAESEWHRRLRVQKEKEANERQLMARADAEGRQFNVYLLEQDKIKDEQKFVYYAGKFGPLDGLTYVSSTRPGRLYESILSDACRVVQKWWRDIGPQRMLRKQEAANFMQKLYRGRKGRETFVNEQKVKKSLKKLFNRVASAAMEQWRYQVRTRKGTRRLLRNRLMGAKSETFEAWSDLVKEIVKHVKWLKIKHPNVDYQAKLYNKILSKEDFYKIKGHYHDLNLPSKIKRNFKKNEIKKIIQFMRKDKKNTSKKINLILLKKIGKTTKPQKYLMQASKIKNFLESFY